MDRPAGADERGQSLAGCLGLRNGFIASEDSLVRLYDVGIDHQLKLRWEQSETNFSADWLDGDSRRGGF